MPEPAQNPAFREAVHESFQRQKFMATLGAKLIRVEAGEVDIELPWTAALEQQTGSAHAGAITAIADSACGYAALTMMPAGSEVVSVEFKINLLAPARGERFVARGRVVRSGRTLTICTADVVAFPGEVTIATMLGTMIRR
jgi:uncharacterized protein (TIGR00369 family)